ncbi:MAG: serine protease [Candidatus Thiodiazotropha endolucinida]
MKKYSKLLLLFAIASQVAIARFAYSELPEPILLSGPDSISIIEPHVIMPGDEIDIVVDTEYESMVKIHMRKYQSNKSNFAKLFVVNNANDQIYFFQDISNTLTKTKWLQARELVLRVPSNSPPVLIEKVLKQTSEVIMDSNVGPGGAQFHSIDQEDNELIRLSAQGVVLVKFPSRCKNEDGVFQNSICLCSGFLVSEFAVITAYHCISDNEVAKKSSVVFDFNQQDSEGEEINILRLIDYSKGLDFALLELEHSPINVTSKILTIRTDKMYDKDKEEIRLIHHFRGKHKVISYDSYCNIYDVGVAGYNAKTEPDADFEHGCDSDARSSGAPIVSALYGDVIGLHHFGRPEGDSDKYPYNQAVIASKIKNHILREKTEYMNKKLLIGFVEF